MTLVEKWEAIERDMQAAFDLAREQHRLNPESAALSAHHLNCVILRHSAVEGLAAARRCVAEGGCEQCGQPGTHTCPVLPTFGGEEMMPCEGATVGEGGF